MVKSTSSIASSSDLKNAVLTKAQFEALAAERRKNRAGSGFDEFGKHYDDGNSVLKINDGLYSYSTVPNLLRWGRTDSFKQGDSKTDYPIANIHGIDLHINGVKRDSLISFNNDILFPDVPTVTHADASNSGMILNGRNMIDTSGWTAPVGCTLSIVDNEIVITSTIAGSSYIMGQAFSTEIGIEYTVEAKVSQGIGDRFVGVQIRSGNTTGAVTEVENVFEKNGRVQFTFIADNTVMAFTIQVYSATIGNTSILTEAFICPSYEISRSDLAFLEVWHEDINEKGIVYPYGNVQYLAEDTDGLTGITTGTFTGKDTYSLFGNWQAPNNLVGKGYILDNLSPEDKVKFLSNRKNNCYQDDDKIIQVRYRIRVVQGLSDVWSNVDSQYIAAGLRCTHDNYHYVAVKGKQTNIVDEFITTTHFLSSKQTLETVDEKNDGLFYVRQGIYSAAAAYNDKAYALPIALVHRRNNGSYHPKFNPNGCSNWRNAIDTANLSWFHADIYKNIQSISQAFTISGTGFVRSSGTYQGSIASAFSNRPDGLYYDQIHESDIIDLRNSSNKITDLKRLLEKEVNRIISGGMRGIEGESNFSYIKIQGTNLSQISGPAFNQQPLSTGLSSYWVRNNSSSAIQVAKIISGGSSAVDYVLVNPGSYIKYDIPYNYRIFIQGSYGSTVTTVDVELALVKGEVTQSNRKKSNTLLHCDIIGNPTNYYRGQTHTDTGVSKVIELNIGDVIWNRDGNDINGLNGHFYKSIVYVASHDLLNSDYTNATYWVDLGTEWDGPGSWRTGTMGTPLLVGENGEDYIPDASGKDIKLSKKVNGTTVYQLKSLDYGVTWSSSPTYAVGTTDNRLANQTLNIPGHELWMVFYKTNSNLTEPVINNEILEINDVNIITSNNVQYGNTLMESLIHKVGIDALNESRKIELTKYSLLDTNKLYSALPPFTATGESNPSGTNNPAIKVLPYLTEANNKLFLQFLFKEMKYDVTWGDSDTFNIVDNISTTTDDNGNSILIGQKRIELPYFIRKDD